MSLFCPLCEWLVVQKRMRRKVVKRVRVVPMLASGSVGFMVGLFPMHLMSFIPLVIPSVFWMNSHLSPSSKSHALKKADNLVAACLLWIHHYLNSRWLCGGKGRHSSSAGHNPSTLSSTCQCHPRFHFGERSCKPVEEWLLQPSCCSCPLRQWRHSSHRLWQKVRRQWWRLPEQLLRVQ